MEREGEGERGDDSYHSSTEEAKRFEDGLQEQKDFLSIQRKYVRLLHDLKHAYMYYCQYHYTMYTT